MQAILTHRPGACPKFPRGDPSLISDPIMKADAIKAVKELLSEDRVKQVIKVREARVEFLNTLRNAPAPDNGEMKSYAPPNPTIFETDNDVKGMPQKPKSKEPMIIQVIKAPLPKPSLSRTVTMSTAPPVSVPPPSQTGDQDWVLDH